MDVDSQAIFDAITAKPAAMLSAEEVAFLRARRSYLSEADRKAFSEILEEKEQSKPISKMNKEELLAEAEKQGVEVPEGASKTKLVELLTKKA